MDTNSKKKNPKISLSAVELSQVVGGAAAPRKDSATVSLRDRFVAVKDSALSSLGQRHE